MATVKHHGRFILRLSPLARFGKPAIFNTDRGSQSTSAALYVDIYLKGDVDGREARARIGAWTAFYNTTLPHQALCNRTPMAVWRAGGDIDEVVDMTLLVPRSLDNAPALPTYPQPQQPQALIA